MKLTLLLVCLIILNSSQAQRGFLLVQKKGKTVSTFTTTSNITVWNNYNHQISGILGHVRKDSFSILQYRIGKKMDVMGFTTFDTIYQGYIFFHKDDVLAISRKKPKGRGFKLLSGIGILGGSAMTVLNLVNGRRFGYKTTKDYLEPIALKGGIPIAVGIGLAKFYKEEFKIKGKWGIALMQY